MPIFKHYLTPLIIIPFLFACDTGTKVPKKMTEQVAADTTATELDQLLQQDWQRNLKANPDFASYLGDDRYNDRWADKSLTTIEANHQADIAVLAKAKALNREALSVGDQLNLDLFIQQTDMTIKAFEFMPHLIPMNQMGGIQNQNDLVNFINFTQLKDYQDWLARLEKLPSSIEQDMALMRQGIKLGVMPPKAIMLRVPAQIEKQIVSEAKSSLYYQAFNEFPKTINISEQQALQAQAETIITNQIVPAYQKLYDFFTKEYLPACRETDGLWDMPQGKAHYKYLVRYFTTTDLTPDEIHEIGLQEVARNREAMDKIIKELDFKGSFAEFTNFLRTDEQFYYKTPEELYHAYLAISKKLDPELVHLFGKLPRAPYGVKPIPDAMAPDTTTAYYNAPAADGSRAGYYYVNLYQPETRPKYEMEVLSVHEAVPGHHLQLALQQELGELPEFRRHSGFTVFVEGWGLYSERLGYDMGLYKDPYSRFGQLTYDMWRAVRLVVDTGMHHKGWTRQQAIDYFMANAAKSEQDITNEIDRYLAWPGQALAYKIGQLKMLELRAKAEAALGKDFDIRGFHDTLLGSGSIPLNVLEANINLWIKQRLATKGE